MLGEIVEGQILALSPSKTRVAVVGVKGVTSGGAADDDAVLMVMKLVP